MSASWRDYLTDEEAKVVKASDDAKAKWRETVAERAFIMNRAIQRKRFAERRNPSLQDSEV